MEFFYLIYLIIPLLIILNVNEADTEETKKTRLLYAIPSFIMILFIALLYLLRGMKIIDFIEMIDYNPELFLVPLLLTLIPVIFYFSGKKKEKYIHIDMAMNEAKIAREKGTYNQTTIDVNLKSDDDIETL